MKRLAAIALAAILCLALPQAAQAFTYDIAAPIILEDTATTTSMDDGNTWYQWIYEVTIVEGETNRRGLSHFTLFECYDEEFLATLASTAGANGLGTNDSNLASLVANEERYYELPPEIGTDPTTSVYGLKWNMDDDSPNEFNTIGDVEYFWFSAPTNQSQLAQSVIKAGNDPNLFIPTAVPDCDPCDPKVPEPMSMVLFGSGLVGIVIRKRLS